MKIKKITMIGLMAFLMASPLFSQDYNTGIGLRAGYYNGLTVKYFVSDKAAAEFLIASRWRGFEVTGLYEIHNRAFDTDRLKWYYGAGAHVGFWNSRYTNWGDPNRDYTVVGIDGILGIEYSFAEAPINIGLDWKPAFNIVGYTGFWGDGGALSIRYVF